MRGLALSALVLSSFGLIGCVGAVTSVAKAPFKVLGKTADVLTTSQSEADEKRGRAIRKREEELGKLDRRYDKELKKCRDGDRRACNAASETYAEMQVLSRSLPVEPE
jgi:hypothetical protein